jgi:hypothetical protein
VGTALLGKILADLFVAIGTEPGLCFLVELYVALVASCFKLCMPVDKITRHQQHVFRTGLQGGDKKQAH